MTITRSKKLVADIHCGTATIDQNSSDPIALSLCCTGPILIETLMVELKDLLQHFKEKL